MKWVKPKSLQNNCSCVLNESENLYVQNVHKMGSKLVEKGGNFSNVFLIQVLAMWLVETITATEKLV